MKKSELPTPTAVIDIIPNHVCTAINLMDRIYVCRGEEMLTSGWWRQGEKSFDLLRLNNNYVGKV